MYVLYNVFTDFIACTYLKGKSSKNTINVAVSANKIQLKTLLQQKSEEYRDSKLAEKGWKGLKSQATRMWGRYGMSDGNGRIWRHLQ